MRILRCGAVLLNAKSYGKVRCGKPHRTAPHREKPVKIPIIGGLLVLPGTRDEVVFPPAPCSREKTLATIVVPI